MPSNLDNQLVEVLQIFDENLDNGFTRTNKTFVLLILLQLILSIAVVSFVSQYSWQFGDGLVVNKMFESGGHA